MGREWRCDIVIGEMRLLFVVFLLTGPRLFAAECEKLTTLPLRDTTISTAQMIPAGSFTPPGGKPINNLPGFCRVAGVIKPSGDSNIESEVWLPVRGGTGSSRASETAGTPAP